VDKKIIYPALSGEGFLQPPENPDLPRPWPDWDEEGGKP
jgi:hypothetical protein